MAPTVGAYDELKLRIEPGREGGYRVLATSSVGEASTSFALPFSDLEVENFVLRVSRPRGRRRIDNSAIEDAKRFGGALFGALFQEKVRDIYHEALIRAQAEGRGLRVTLCLSDAPDLMDVPWEYLYDTPDFLAVSAFTPVVRYLDLPRGYRPLRVDPPLRILGMVSSPSDYEQLDIDRERANLEGALAELVERGAVEIHWLQSPTLSALLRMLQSQPFHILHFVGHGSYDKRTEQGVLLLQDDNGYGRPVTGDQLGMLLRDFTSLRLAVLNACEGARTSRTDPFAGVAASLVARDIPAVIAMQFEITDISAVAFAEGFYRALASGASVDASLAAARLSIFAQRSDDIEWGTPVLFMRVGDGQIFDVPEPVDGPPAAIAAPTTPVAEPAIPVAEPAPPVAEPAPPVAEPAPPVAEPAPATPVARAATAPAAPAPVATEAPSRRAPWRWIAGAAAAALLVLVVVLISSGSKSPSTPANVGGLTPTQTSSGGQTSTTAPAPPPARPTVVTGSWPGNSGTLHVVVTKVQRTGSTLQVSLTASSTEQWTIGFYGHVVALGSDGQKYDVPAASSAENNDIMVPPGASVPDTFEVDGVSGHPASFTIYFSFIFAPDVSQHDAMTRGLKVAGIPVPR